MKRHPAGRCWNCGCTEDDPCRVAGGDVCSWHDHTRTLCNAPGCLKKYFATRKPLRKRTPGQIHDLIRQEKNRKQRERRARAKVKRA